MNTDTIREVEELRCASIARVRAKYRELFGEEPRTRHRESLFRRVAWRMQALAEGGLSARARLRASAIADDANLRVLAPRGLLDGTAASIESLGAGRARSRYDTRIPRPGTVLEREFRGTAVTAKVLPDGFEYQGRRYRSLSAIACEVTGTRWNGLAFFALTGKPAKRKEGRRGK